MAAPTPLSQKGLEVVGHLQHPHNLTKPWQRVVARGALVACLLWFTSTLLRGHHGLETIWKHPSELAWSDLGLWPSMRRYASLDLQMPAPKFLRSDARCEPGYIFVAPGGLSPMILDSRGDLVWTARSSAATENFRVQKYRGQDYLTYWLGEPFGPGYYYMVSRTILFEWHAC